ncbi:MAG: uracil-DNA glycosylase family protein [Bacillota bacterium]
MELKSQVQDYLAKYNVSDVINADMDYLFILESPHKAEIKNDYPVAGNSGIEMTKFIYSQDCDDAFGKLVSQVKHYQADYEGLNKFGIMNVSSAPMQESALQDYKLSAVEEQVLHILEKLRVNYQAKTHRNSDWNKTKEVVVNNFRTRLEEVLSNCNPDYIIPCGKLAQEYIDLVDLENELSMQQKIIYKIPHPSRNQWRHYDAMDELEDVLTADIDLK